MTKLNAKTRLLLIQMLWGASRVMHPSFRKLNEGFEAWAYRNGLLRQIYRLEAIGYVESRPEEYDAGRVHRLTEAGRLAALGGRDPQERWERNWDGKWRLFLFDIPESQRIDRQRLTRALASVGCGCMQGSVWISPFRPAGLDKALKEDGSDCSHLMILEADSRGREVDRRMVAAAWDFAAINALYRKHLDLLRELPSSAADTTPEALARWGEKENDAWLAAVRHDPLLPARLLPKDYLGRKAWRQRTKALAQAGRLAENVLADGE